MAKDGFSQKIHVQLEPDVPQFRSHNSTATQIVFCHMINHMTLDTDLWKVLTDQAPNLSGYIMTGVNSIERLTQPNYEGV